MASPVKIDVFYYVPVLNRGRRSPLVYYEHMSPTRKGAISKLIENSYRGAHDWTYRRKIGWTIERVTISNGERASG